MLSFIDELWSDFNDNTRNTLSCIGDEYQISGFITPSSIVICHIA